MDKDCYLKGFEDCLDLVLIELKKSKNLEEAKVRIEVIYTELKENKYEVIRKMLNLD
ncbi:hypothetical protein [Saccharolobus sp. E5-1-F]|uniref:hypothetical protein n=1 Tax=Saccharolobus sp. E5-1-F TaxID=2663019 RepID=UPI00142F4981|nr:hypothetical protein [Sulfolobus sp. E5-1-F]